MYLRRRFALPGGAENFVRLRRRLGDDGRRHSRKA